MTTAAMETDQFLDLQIFWLKILGTQRLESTNKLLQLSHRIYAIATIVFCVGFLLSMDLELFYSDDITVITDVLKVSTNLIFSLVRYAMVRSASLNAMQDNVRSTEKIIRANANADVHSIFAKTKSQLRWITMTFLAMGYTALAGFYVVPTQHAIAHWSEPKVVLDGETNRTVYLPRQLPYAGVFPFDKNKYYWVAYAFHVISGTFTCSCVVIPDVYFWGLMLYAAMRIKVLQYKLQHFRRLACDKSQRRIVSVQDEDAILMSFISDLVKEHRDIIKYVEDLDDKLKYLMLVDSGLSAVQIAIMLLGCIVSGFTLDQLPVFVFLGWAIAQLFFFYYCANEILLAGLDIPMSIWMSDWYICSLKVKKDLLFILMRAQKPLYLNVGPFFTMNLQTMISILKTAFSYFTLMRQMYQKD